MYVCVCATVTYYTHNTTQHHIYIYTEEKGTFAGFVRSMPLNRGDVSNSACCRGGSGPMMRWIVNNYTYTHRQTHKPHI